MGRSIVGWKVEPADRSALLERIAAHYPSVIADHVTLRFGTDEQTPLPSACAGEVVGAADDGKGVQALVVRIEGTTHRGDGSHYHITFSLGAGRKAKESNDVIRDHGWRPIEPPIPVRLIPTRWDG
ncbi:hypothetical protein [Sphingobium bisphenolivorans]|uniref:hypothetical protein n=1 Tax=Sphingobium bisphenolivorans TaxID=1335760 RepID=UPI00039E7080|nr:hypothetical protein [Sphingobium bisphenolivorans]